MPNTRPDDEPSKSMEARGFVLAVSADEAKAAAAGTTLAAVIEELKAITAQLVPTAEIYAAVAVVKEGSGSSDVDAVRRALHDQAPAAEAGRASARESGASAAVVDIGRKRVLLGGRVIALTYKEFELLQFLVLREGQTVHRSAIIDALWSHREDDGPGTRTVDVLVRRLRGKLGSHGSIVRTVHRAGYRFDHHPDVTVRYAPTRSPDTF